MNGVLTDSEETRLSIFADDLTAFLANKTSFDNRQSQKTVAYRLGKSLLNPPATLADIKKVNKPIYRNIRNLFYS